MQEELRLLIQLENIVTSLQSAFKLAKSGSSCQNGFQMAQCAETYEWYVFDCVSTYNLGSIYYEERIEWVVVLFSRLEYDKRVCRGRLFSFTSCAFCKCSS